jgi:hypothetical protein
MDEALKPWDRQPDEPNLWFRRFEQFRRMGPKRSILGCLNKELNKKGQKKTGDIPSAWRDASEAWKWRARAEAWDQYQSELEEQEWEARRKKLRDQEWEMAQAMFNRAKEMLAYPLTRVKKEEQDGEGHVVAVTIEPAEWKVLDIVKFMDVSSKLGRLAADMVTGKVEVVDWRAKAEEAGINPQELKDELVKAIRRRMASGANGRSPTDSRGDGGSRASGKRDKPGSASASG